MMSEMEEDVRVMVVTEGNRVALGDKPYRPHVACLTIGWGCLTPFVTIIIFGV